ncbi:hypothetical protein L4D20_05785 [Vibrio kyushuensis]|uniref:hypothetical protein n=1 Tax=Vibrio kyushuensis TaxID=2910249 RepID=UPI003D11BBD7
MRRLTKLFKHIQHVTILKDLLKDGALDDKQSKALRYILLLARIQTFLTSTLLLLLNYSEQVIMYWEWMSNSTLL